MRSSLLVLLLCFISGAEAKSQAVRISGKVIDAESRTPLVAVNVFISGTTLGDATDEDGYFSIPAPDLEQFTVVASMVGYAVWQREYRFLPQDPIAVELKPGVIALEGMRVEADEAREWRRLLRRFEELIFNDTPFGNQCEILNPEVLDFELEEYTGKLRGAAKEPLIILNTALGYRIQFHNVQMRGDEKEVFWDGEPLFIELVPDSERTKEKWMENRERAYQGSLRHFLKALFSAKLKEEGFEAFFVQDVWDQTRSRYTEIFEMQIAEVAWDSSRVATRPILFPTGNELLRRLAFGGVLHVRFNREGEPWEYHQWMIQHQFRRYEQDKPRHQASWLIQPGSFTVIDAMGRQFNESALWRYGFFSWERVGEMLPHDFEPPEM